MLSRKEFEVTVTLRNNLLLQKRMETGYSPLQIADKIGLSYMTYLAYEGLRYDPWYTRRDCWKQSALRISDFFKVAPEDLWPSIVRDVKRTKVVREMGAAQVHRLLGDHTQKMLTSSPEDLYLELENTRRVKRALRALPKHLQSDLMAGVKDFEKGEEDPWAHWSTHRARKVFLQHYEHATGIKPIDPRKAWEKKLERRKALLAYNGWTIEDVPNDLPKGIPITHICTDEGATRVVVLFLQAQEENQERVSVSSYSKSPDGAFIFSRDGKTVYYAPTAFRVGYKFMVHKSERSIVAGTLESAAEEEEV